MTTRRSFLTGSASAAAALSTAAMAQTAQNTRQAEGDHSSSNPGQSNTGLV
ncbi:MAG: twin-arginine translocation signal domain-containing protein, partial [Terriglobus roseus]|nr:twin-arginine translocation signal domain-containing protein [Terriglobus roseus]